MNQAPDFRGFFLFGLAESGRHWQLEAPSFDGIDNGVASAAYHPDMSVPSFHFSPDHGTGFT